MTRRLVVAAALLAVVGGSAAGASAAGTPGPLGSTTQEVKKVCVVVFNDPASPQRDGICVWTPNLPF